MGKGVEKVSIIRRNYLLKIIRKAEKIVPLSNLENYGEWRPLTTRGLEEMRVLKIMN